MRPGKKTRPRGGDNSYWTSYSDMMAGMLFVFALILFAAVYQLVDLQQKKTVEQKNGICAWNPLGFAAEQDRGTGGAAGRPAGAD